MAAVIVPLDVIEIDGVAEAVDRVEPPCVRPQMPQIDQPVAVALEVPVIDRVEADERREEPDVGEREPVADQKTTSVRQTSLQPVERLEQDREGPVVGRLRFREAAAIDAVVHVGVDAGVHRLDLVPQLFGIERRTAVERLVQHTDDLGAFVRDDRPPRRIPEHRHGDGARRLPVGPEIDVPKVTRPVRIGHDTPVRRVAPAILAHDRVDHGDRDRRLEPLETADDQRPVRPRTRERDVQPVAARLGGEAALAGRPRPPVPRDPVPPTRGGAFERAVLPGRERPVGLPDPVDEPSHVRPRRP